MTQNSNAKVTREGVVTVDGRTVGHVKKEMRQGIFATMSGASHSATGTPYWVPFADDGACLSETGYDTRKRAVERIVKHAAPLAVTDVKREFGIGSYRECVTAWVRWRGYSFGVSRYAHEPYWVVDFLATPDSIMPVFSNGTGSRVTRVQTLKPEMADAATAAAVVAGLWPMTDGGAA